MVPGIALEKGPGRLHQPLTFRRGDACHGVAEASVIAQANFHENEISIVLHDDVEFAQPAAEIAGYHLQSALAQKVHRGGFSLGTRPGLGRQSADPAVTTGRGSKRPLRITPHASSR